MQTTTMETSVNSTESSKTAFSYSDHAKVRKAQTNITDEDVTEALQKGSHISYSEQTEVTVHIDDKTKVVKAGDHIITVISNSRNTRFDIMRSSKDRETTLLYEVFEHENDRAMCELAELYLSGDLGKMDVDFTYSLLLKAASLRNSHAMCLLSGMYSSGVFGAPDMIKSNMWMLRAAERENAHALAYSGQMLMRDYFKLGDSEEDVAKKEVLKAKIMTYLEDAMKKTGSRGTWQLANIYETGLLGETDLPRAIEMYVNAATTGSHSSLHCLHRLALCNNFDVDECEKVFDKAALHLTNSSIGKAYEIGTEQLYEKTGFNPFRGLWMVQKAALKKHIKAMKQLVVCYRDGVVCEENLQLAQYWYSELKLLYEQSSAKGNVNSLWNLGKMYLKGHTGEIDLAKAESCFVEAAEKSRNPDWYLALAMMYLDGRLGDKNPDICYKFLGNAIEIWEEMAEQSKSVHENLANIYTNKKLNLASNAKATDWLSKGANLGSFDCKTQLTFLYFRNGDLDAGLQILEELTSECPSVASLLTSVSISSCIDENYIEDKRVVSWLNHKASTCDNSELKKIILSGLAREYNIGRFGQNDHILASNYFHQLLQEFDSFSAASKLVKLYDYLPDEYQNSVREWVSLLETRTGNAEVCFHRNIAILLGTVYRNGKILPQNIQQAYKWLLLPSYMDLPEYSAKIVKQELQELAQYPPLTENERQNILVELSALTDNTKTNPDHYKYMTRILGDLYYDGKFVNQNLPTAIDWYTKSAGMNNAKATYSLGKINQITDVNEAIKWYKLSARLGNKEALAALHSLFAEHPSDDIGSFLKKYKHRSLVPDCELENVKPLRNLQTYPKGVKEMRELGLKYRDAENSQEAAYWLRKCMKKEDILSAVELAKMYRKGALGENLKSVSENMCLDILDMFIMKCKFSGGTPEGKAVVISVLQSASDAFKEIPPDRFFEEVTKSLDEVIALNELNYDVFKRCSENLIAIREERSTCKVLF